MAVVQKPWKLPRRAARALKCPHARPGSLPPEGAAFLPWGGPAAANAPTLAFGSLPPEGAAFSPWGGPAAKTNGGPP